MVVYACVRVFTLAFPQSSLTPTVPPPPDLSDGTPVYLYAVICSSDCRSGTPPCLLCADPRGIYKFLEMLRTFAGLFAVSLLCDL
jgi:hypothetical protein